MLGVKVLDLTPAYADDDDLMVVVKACSSRRCLSPRGREFDATDMKPTRSVDLSAWRLIETVPNVVRIRRRAPPPEPAAPVRAPPKPEPAKGGDAAPAPKKPKRSRPRAAPEKKPKTPPLAPEEPKAAQDEKVVPREVVDDEADYAYSSPYVGVYYGGSGSSTPWRSQIGELGVPIKLGSFATQEEAAQAFDARARILGRPVNFPRAGETQARKPKRSAKSGKSGGGAPVEKKRKVAKSGEAAPAEKKRKVAKSGEAAPAEKKRRLRPRKGKSEPEAQEERRVSARLEATATKRRQPKSVARSSARPASTASAAPASAPLRAKASIASRCPAAAADEEEARHEEDERRRERKASGRCGVRAMAHGRRGA
ncbi:hypothetical protein JL720_14477 [Aureococcus anophagefferens]|nr:hypothetical protein JL720_14477 [Aureococcus anophagefferens]